MDVRVFKTKWLARFVRRERIADRSLREAIERAGGLIKQRVARDGKGRSGGYRMMVAYRTQGLAVFLYAFAKNDRDNIEPDELLSLREIAERWLQASEAKIALAIADGALQEVDDGEED